MAPKGDLAETRRRNDQVLELVKSRGAALFAIGSVHPDDGEEALAELERLERLGFKMIKLHPSTQKFDVGSASVNRVVGRAAELGLPIIFDSYSPFDPDQVGDFVALALANPRAKIVLAHMGGAKFLDMFVFAVLARYPMYQRNVWFELSGTVSFFADSPLESQLVWLIRQLGTDRVLFGSDFPVTTPANAIEDVHRLGLTPEEERQVLFSTAEALLELRPERQPAPPPSEHR